MSDLVFCGLTAAFAVLGLLVILLDLNRRRWREIAENRQRFIDDCNKAADVPPFFVFGPSFLTMQAKALHAVNDRLKNKNRILADALRIKNRYRERGDALERQAKRWAKTAKGQRETISELMDLLKNDTERIADRATADGVDQLRELGFILTTQDHQDAARFLYAAAAVIEARLLRSPQTDEHAQNNYEFLKFVIDAGDFLFRGIGEQFEPWAIECVKPFHGLEDFMPQALACYNDTNGDGDCEICACGNACRPKEAADEPAHTV